MGRAEWAGVADALFAETGADNPPQDAFLLAAVCGLRTRPWGKSYAMLDGDVVRYPGTARPVRQHGLVAHETSHYLLEHYGEEDSEEGARFLSGALMLPRRPFDRDLSETSWHLGALRAKHLNVSAEMIARRVVELRDAVATVFDNNRATWRVASSWLDQQAFGRVTEWERRLADTALESGEIQQGDDLVWALPLLDGPWRRVVLVAEAEQLSLRF